MRARLLWREALIALIIAGPLAVSSVHATDGLNYFGLGARNRAMGGANAAAPVDTSTIYINPAGLGRLGSTTDFGVHVHLPDRYIDRSNATGPLANIAGGFEESGQSVYVTPFSGVSWRSPESPWSFGMMIGGVTSAGATYDRPRIDPNFLLEPDLATPISATGDTYDTSSFLYVIKVIPAISYQVADRLSVGVALDVDLAWFGADFAVATPGGLTQTAGSGRTEVSYLMGFQLGLLYDINEHWSVGVAYTSRQWQLDDFGRYEDLIPGFELPPEVRIGWAFAPTDLIRLTSDYRYIGWEQIALFENLPSGGGFGWQDQHTVGIGLEAVLTRWLIGRLGWNYGRSPIRSEVTFANSLLPAISTSHLGGGFELLLGKHNSIATSFVGTFDKTQVDNGQGDLFSQQGAGVRVGYTAFDFDITWTVRF